MRIDITASAKNDDIIREDCYEETYRLSDSEKITNEDPITY